MSKFAILRHWSFLKPIIKVRDRVMNKFGLFKKKQQWKKYISFKTAKITDNLKKAKFRHEILHSDRRPLTISDGTNITISMTSYGKRVRRFAPYALWSILQQSKQPNRVVLNISKDTWSNKDIPRILKQLMKFGVEINLTEDIGPHTKLIPTLQKYEEDIIITVDDDVYYDKTMITELYNAYIESDKKKVICREGKVLLKDQEKFLPYSKQPGIREYDTALLRDAQLLPFGVAGVLYPPQIFGPEVFNKEIFRKLCPSADDVWFGIMELYYGIRQIYVKDNSWSGDCDIDKNEEYIEKGSSALHFQNDIHGKNDIQFKALLNYYNIEKRN